MIDLNEIEVLRVALAHEERARAFYRRLADRLEGSPAGDLFAILSREEEGHIRRIAAVHKVPAFEAKREERFLPYLIDLDRLAWEAGIEAEHAAPADSIRKGLGIARKAEAHAIDFYGRAGAAAADPAVRALLDALREEERIHLARIEAFARDLG